MLYKIHNLGFPVFGIILRLEMKSFIMASCCNCHGRFMHIFHPILTKSAVTVFFLATSRVWCEWCSGWCVPAVDCMQRSHGLPRVWWRLLVDWLPVRRWIVSCHCQFCVLLPSAVARNFQCGHAHQNNSHCRNLQKGTLQRYYWFSTCASLSRVRQRI